MLNSYVFDFIPVGITFHPRPITVGASGLPALLARESVCAVFWSLVSAVIWHQDLTLERLVRIGALMIVVRSLLISTSCSCRNWHPPRLKASGLRSGFEPPDLDRPCKQLHQQALSEVRLGYRDRPTPERNPGTRQCRHPVEYMHFRMGVQR